MVKNSVRVRGPGTSAKGTPLKLTLRHGTSGRGSSASHRRDMDPFRDGFARNWISTWAVPGASTLPLLNCWWTTHQKSFGSPANITADQRQTQPHAKADERSGPAIKAHIVVYTEDLRRVTTRRSRNLGLES